MQPFRIDTILSDYLNCDDVINDIVIPMLGYKEMYFVVINGELQCDEETFDKCKMRQRRKNTEYDLILGRVCKYGCRYLDTVGNLAFASRSMLW